MERMRLVLTKLSIILLFIINCTITIKCYSATKNDTTTYEKKIEMILQNLEVINHNLSYKNDSILHLTKQMLDLSKTINYNEGTYLSYYYLGRIWRLRNYNDSAIYYFKKGLETTVTKQNHLENFYMQLSTVQRITGNFSAALENALKLKELVENNSDSYYKYQVYNLLALSYQTLMEYDLAKNNFEKSAELAQKANNEAYAGVIYSNIGKLLFEQDKLDESLSYFEKGTALEKKHRLTSNLGNSYTIIAQIYMKKNMLDSAKYYLFQATDLNKKDNNKIGLTNTLLSVSNYYYMVQDYKNALFHLDLTIKNALQYKLQRVLSEAYQLKANIYANEKDFEKAYHYYELFFSTHEKLYNFKEINSVKTLEQKLFKKERENEFYELRLAKQKTINHLIILISSLVLLVGIVILVFLVQTKKLNKELVVAKTKAEESDKLKSKFLQTISHEIRTPLNGIVGFSEMIRSKELRDSELDQINSMINKNTDDLISTIENLVDIAHLSTNQYNVKKSDVHIVNLLENIINRAQENPVYKTKENLELIFHKNEDVVINTDKNIISKILLHLVKNAILYTNKGAITVGYKKDKSSVIFYVKDTGIGIPQEKIDAIFTPFTQGNEDISIKVGGTGLGLTIVNGLIKILNGKIWVGSELKKGSTFYISLPIE